jgi:hypothetical protein
MSMTRLTFAAPATGTCICSLGTYCAPTHRNSAYAGQLMWHVLAASSLFNQRGMPVCPR